MLRTRVRTRQQEIAMRAMGCIAERSLGKVDEERNREYVSFAKKFPALIHTCGLALAVAFACAKSHKDYLEDLIKVMGFEEGASADNVETLQQKFMEKIVKADVREYILLTQSTMEASLWLKRYAEAAEADAEKDRGMQ